MRIRIMLSTITASFLFTCTGFALTCPGGGFLEEFSGTANMDGEGSGASKNVAWDLAINDAIGQVSAQIETLQMICEEIPNANDTSFSVGGYVYLPANADLACNDDTMGNWNCGVNVSREYLCCAR